MWVNYALVLISVVMFGGGFAFQDLYRKKRGSGLKASMESACIGAVAGLIVLLVINKFKFEFTPYTLLMAFLAAINGILFTFCSFKALEYINLSLFSLFAMLGGMMLPFLQGIAFYGEGITLAKVICVLFIVVALIFTIDKSDKKKGGIFYLGVFVLNGISGVLSKFFTESTYPKTSVEGYSIWMAIITVVITGAVWIIISLREKGKIKNEESEVLSKKVILQSVWISAVYGVINKVANYFLVVALVYLQSSIQYPLVTGGTMIVSTVLGFFNDKKPTKRDLLSVAFAFVGMIALFLIKI